MKAGKSKIVDRNFFVRDAHLVAYDLLGKVLVHEDQNRRVSGMIVELEVYSGPEDAASHSYKNLGSTRTDVQFHVGGFAYVYTIYGVYHCFNVVVNKPHKPEAVFIRALEPLEGIEIMQKKRKTENTANLCSGPGKLCMALDINKTHNGADLCNGTLYLEHYKSFSKDEVQNSPRINIDYAGEAKDYLWRYYIKNNRFVSKTPRKAP